MNSIPGSRVRSLRQSGQSMTEFTIVCFMLAFFLFIVTPAGRLLTDAIRAFYADLTLFLSLP